MMSSFLLALGVGIVVMASAVGDTVHTMTDAGAYPPQERVPELPHHGRQKRQACGTATLLTSAQQTEALNMHNTDRSLEPSSNEFVMNWDVNLAARAQQYAAQCVWQHGMLTDCAGNTIGQNLYMTWSSNGQFPALNMTNVVQSWWNERQYWNYTTATCQPNQVCGHFTQLTWSTTTAVGCGYYNCPSVYVPGGTNVTNGVFVVCDYSPAGNVVGVQPFTIGAACSNCASVTRKLPGTRGYTCNNGLCSACDPTTDATCQCGPADSCSGVGTWQTSTCTCQCSPGYYGTSCQNACVDVYASSSCQYWKGLNYCLPSSVYYSFMKGNCVLTCGFCS